MGTIGNILRYASSKDDVNGSQRERVESSRGREKEGEVNKSYGRYKRHLHSTSIKLYLLGITLTTSLGL